MGATVVFRSGHCISRLQHQDFAWGPEMARLGTAKWPDLPIHRRHCFIV